MRRKLKNRTKKQARSRLNKKNFKEIKLKKRKIKAPAKLLKRMKTRRKKAQKFKRRYLLKNQIQSQKATSTNQQNLSQNKSKNP